MLGQINKLNEQINLQNTEYKNKNIELNTCSQNAIKLNV
jgi:hypothetical protein